MQHILRHADAVARLDAHAVRLFAVRIIRERPFKLQRIEILGAALAVSFHAFRLQLDCLRQSVDRLPETQLPAQRVCQLQNIFIRLRFCAAGENFVRVGKPMRQILKLTFVRRMNVCKVFSHVTPPKWFRFWRSARD